MNKQLALLLLLAAFGGDTLTEGKSAETQLDKRTAVTAWPVSKTFVRLVDARFGAMPGERVSSWGWVNAPVSVVEAVRKIFVGKKETWYINRIKDYERSGKTVVIIADSADHVIVSLATRYQWIRLNDNAGLTFIDQLVSARWKGKLSTATLDEQRNYTRAVLSLFRGPRNIALSHEEMELLRRVSTAFDLSLGREKRKSELAKFCVDPVFTQDGGDMQLVFNVMTGQGAIERWTVSGREDKRFAARGITIDTMKKNGAFIYNSTDY